MRGGLPLLALAAFAAAAPAPEPAPRAVRGEFECRLSEEWTGRDSWSGPMPLYAFVRAGPGAQSPVISVEKFPAGNRLYRSPAGFLASLSGLLAGRPLKASVSGKDERLHERRYRRNEPAAGLGEPASWDVREKLVILKADGGFFVLRLRAPEGAFKEAEPDFLEFLRTFRLLGKAGPRRKPT